MKRETSDDRAPSEYFGSSGAPFDLVHVKGPAVGARARAFSDASPPPQPPEEWPAELEEALPAGLPYRRSARQVFVQVAGWALLTLGLWGAMRMLEQPRAREAIFEWVTLGHERQVRGVKQSIEEALRGVTQP